MVCVMDGWMDGWMDGRIIEDQGGHGRSHLRLVGTTVDLLARSLLRPKLGGVLRAIDRLGCDKTPVVVLLLRITTCRAMSVRVRDRDECELCY